MSPCCLITKKYLHTCVPKHFGAQAQFNSLPDHWREPLYSRSAWPALRNRRVQWSCLREASADKCERRTSSVKNPVRPSPRLPAVGSSPHFIRSLVFCPPLIVTPLFICQGCGGAFFIDYFLHLHYTEHTLCLALDVGCTRGQAMCVRFRSCHFTRSYNTFGFL